MESRIASVQNRVSDIIQKVHQRVDRFQQYEAGPAAAARFRTQNSSDSQNNTATGNTAAGHKSQTSGPQGRDVRGDVPRPNMTAELSGLLSRPASTSRPSGPSFGAELDRMIESEAGRQAVSPDLIRAVVKAESGGKPDARSKAGALGLMQLMPGTARELKVSDPLNPRENLRGGVQYLNQMAERYGDLDLALAAYNAGPGAVKRYGGVPPYKETQDYIRKIRRELDLDTAPE